MKCEHKTPEEIQGTEKVIESFGRWPCFHDAEVISFSAERALPGHDGTSVARLTVNVREYTTINEGTADYDTVVTKSILIRFMFRGACDFEITDFNQQNVIDSIDISKVEVDDHADLRVEVESIWGFGGVLRCESIEVEAVEELPTGMV